MQMNESHVHVLQLFQYFYPSDEVYYAHCHSYIRQFFQVTFKNKNTEETTNVEKTTKSSLKLYLQRKFIIPANMRPLATTQLMMTWLSMCSADESTTIRQKRSHIAYTLAILVVNVIGCSASLVYCLKFISSDFDSSTFAFMVGIGHFGAIYFMVALILMRHQIDNIFTSLSAFYNTCKFNSIYKNFKIEKLLKKSNNLNRRK